MAGDGGLFAGCRVFINPALGDVAAGELRSKLVANGAVVFDVTKAVSSQDGPDENLIQRFDLEKTTHVITGNIDFPEYSDSLNANIAVVSPSWVNSAIKSNNLPGVEFHSADPKLFMSGIVVSASQNIPEDDQCIIFGGVLAFGGAYRLGLQPDTTHYVTLNSENDPDYSDAINQPDVMVVLPHYFDDCFKIKRRVLEMLYLFPEPKLLTPDPYGLLSQNESSSSEKTDLESEIQILRNETIYIDQDVRLSLNHDRLNQLSVDIIEAGGNIIDHYDDANVTCVILDSRKSEIYFKAERSGKTVASLRWLKDTLRSKKFASPKLKSLHYPRPDPLDEFQNYIICATNYSGQAREDIETMVTHLGGKYTRQMTPDNTHVICSKPISEKYFKALEWNIPTVNHLWLEDSYAEGRVAVMARCQYLVWSPSLQPIVGCTPISSSSISQSILRASKGANHESQISTPKNIKTDNVIERTKSQRAKQSRLSGVSTTLTPAVKKPARRSLASDSAAVCPGSECSSISQNKSVKRRRLALDDGTVHDTSVRLCFTGIIMNKHHRKLAELGGSEVSTVPSCTHLIANKVARTEKFLTAISLAKPIVTYKWLEDSLQKGIWLDIEKYKLVDEEAEIKHNFSLKESLIRASSKPLLEGYSIYVTPQVVPDTLTMRRLIEAAGGKMLEKLQLRKLRSKDSAFKDELLPPGLYNVGSDGQFPSSPHGASTTATGHVLCISSENEVIYHEALRARGFRVYSVELILVGLLRQQLLLDDETFFL